ncbi:MAG TPA: hypothetical protein VF367_05285 [Candidatus Limnocylindria bacterium]
MIESVSGPASEPEAPFRPTPVRHPPWFGRFGIDRASAPSVNEKQDPIDRLNVVEGADAASLGVSPAPESTPADLQPDDDVRLPPGADFDATRNDARKPWFTSLAAESDQAGVGNDPPDEQEPRYPDRAEPH